MTEPAAAFPPRSNPFATRFTRPGAIAPLDAAGSPIDLDEVLGRLTALGGSGSIEGLHGRGKTTVLLALAGRACVRGQAVTVRRVRSVFDLDGIFRDLVRLPIGGTLFIDGWESLGWFPCHLTRCLAAFRGCRLVVTSHRPSGLPRVMWCRTSPRLLAKIVAQLPDPGAVIDAHDVGEAFDRHGGDLRESLYDLYDRFERRARSRVAG